MIKSEETTSVKVGRFTSLSSGLGEGKSEIEHDMTYKSLEHLPVIGSSIVFEPFHAFGKWEVFPRPKAVPEKQLDECK